MFALCMGANGCQLINKLRGRHDAGTHGTTGTLLGDGGSNSPVLALPNPTVAPAPSTNMPVGFPPMPTPDVPSVQPASPLTDASAVVAPEDTGSGIAVVDAGGIPPGMDARHQRNYIRNFCKEHPGRVHPVTHVLCPM
jgi:hypothetical protein